MNVGGIILVFIGVVLIFSGFRKTYMNWYNTFNGTTSPSSTASTSVTSNVGTTQPSGIGSIV
jgi:hypothetical protein